MKLISMTDFVLEQEKQYPCSNYADYLDTCSKVFEKQSDTPTS